MSHHLEIDVEKGTAPRLGSLVRRLPVRVVDISAVGCLLESAQPVDAGSVALLALHIGGRRYVDPVRITRFVRLKGGIWAYRFGAEMLALSPPSVATLRSVALLEGAELVVPPAARTTSSAGEIPAANTCTQAGVEVAGERRSSD